MVPRLLGRSGLSISPIGLGCVTFGREIDRAASFAVLDHAFARGITLLDTAESYGDGASETVLGAWLASRGTRDDVLISTKLSPPLSQARVMAAADASLRRLGTDRIDLYQIHAWDVATPVQETFAALEALLRAGKVRCIGCSNVTADQLGEVLRIQAAHGWRRIDFVQPVYNLVQRGIEAELLPLCRRETLGVISYSPLGAGFLTGKYSADAPVPRGSRFDVKPGHRNIYFTDAAFATLARLAQISQATKLPMIRLALSWAMTRPAVTSVLIGAREPRHIDQAFEARDCEPPAMVSAALDALV